MAGNSGQPGWVSAQEASARKTAVRVGRRCNGLSTLCLTRAISTDSCTFSLHNMYVADDMRDSLQELHNPICTADLIAQTNKNMWNLDKSESCTAINIELNN